MTTSTAADLQKPGKDGENTRAAFDSFSIPKDFTPVTFDAGFVPQGMVQEFAVESAIKSNFVWLDESEIVQVFGKTAAEMG